jgi:hypothetical protein
VTEHVLETGQHEAVVWALTSARLIIAHRDCIPSPRISRARFDELRDNGWFTSEIAAMYGVSKSYLIDGLT